MDLENCNGQISEQNNHNLRKSNCPANAELLSSLALWLEVQEIYLSSLHVTHHVIRCM